MNLVSAKRRGKNERRLWLWSSDHQRDWPVGPTAGVTWLDDGPLGAPGEKNSPEETMPPRLGVVKTGAACGVARIPVSRTLF